MINSKHTLTYGKDVMCLNKQKSKAQKRKCWRTVCLILLLILFPISLPLFTVLNVNLLTFLHWAFAIWEPLLTESACQEDYRHIYKLMAPNQTAWHHQMVYE